MKVRTLLGRITGKLMRIRFFHRVIDSIILMFTDDSLKNLLPIAPQSNQCPDLRAQLYPIVHVEVSQHHLLDISLLVLSNGKWIDQPDDLLLAQILQLMVFVL